MKHLGACAKILICTLRLTYRATSALKIGNQASPVSPTDRRWAKTVQLQWCINHQNISSCLTFRAHHASSPWSIRIPQCNFFLQFTLFLVGWHRDYGTVPVECGCWECSSLPIHSNENVSVVACLELYTIDKFFVILLKLAQWFLIE